MKVMRRLCSLPVCSCVCCSQECDAAPAAALASTQQPQQHQQPHLHRQFTPEEEADVLLTLGAASAFLLDAFAAQVDCQQLLQAVETVKRCDFFIKRPPHSRTPVHCAICRDELSHAPFLYVLVSQSEHCRMHELWCMLLSCLPIGTYLHVLYPTASFA